MVLEVPVGIQALVLLTAPEAQVVTRAVVQLVVILAAVLLMALEAQEMGLEAPEKHLVAQGMEQVTLVAAQEQAMEAVVEMEELAAELGLEKAPALTPQP